MADWAYIVGEFNFSQQFAVIDRTTGEGFDGTGITTATMFIKSSDFATDIPTGGAGTGMAIIQENPLFLNLNVTSTALMPQNEGMFLAQIKLEDATGQVLKTISMNLAVLASIE